MRKTFIGDPPWPPARRRRGLHPEMYKKLPEHEHVISVRTPVVPPSRISAQRLEEWKRYLVKQRGQAREHIEAEIAERTKRFGVPTMQAATPVVPKTDEDVVWQ